MQTLSTLEIRRHRDGSIDFGFYREQAAALRRQRRNAVVWRASIRRWTQSGAGVVAALVRATRAMDRKL